MLPALEPIRGVVESAIAGFDVDLDDLALRRAGGRNLLRVAVDRDGGLTLDEAADLSRVISAALDAESVMGESPYVLEVGSPGVSRPLTLPRHWTRNAGRLVRITTGDSDPFLARIVGLEGDEVVLRTAGGQQRVALATIRKAVVQVELSPGRDLPQDDEED